MHQDLLPRIKELEQAVEQRDANAAAAIIRLFKTKTIYSGNEVYDRLHTLEAELTVVLFEGLTANEFGQLLSDETHLYRFKIWHALESIADRIRVGELWEIKTYLGLPSPRECPKLYTLLETAADENISAQLIETIDQLTALEAVAGTSLSDHEKTMSMFRFVRWSPDDHGLADCVRLLAARDDELARSASREYLLNLPWGADRKATYALLDGMSVKHPAKNKSLFQEALNLHEQPAVLRTWLWGSIGEDNLEECLLGLFADLPGLDNEADRITYIDFIAAVLEQANAEGREFDPRLIASAAENVDSSHWARVSRGYYGAMVTTCLPTANANRVSGRLERRAISIARLWENVRLDHMGCFIPLALMLGMGWIWGFGLDMVLGKPSVAPWLPEMLFWSWIGWALVNVRTHFSGHETIGSKVGVGIVYFTLLFSAQLSAVLVRVVS